MQKNFSHPTLPCANTCHTLHTSYTIHTYPTKVSHDEYLPSGAKIVVDLDPQASEATVAMVKAEYFAGTNNMMVVLAWGGNTRAALHCETPGRLFEVPGSDAEEEGSYSIPPGASMKMRGTNPRGCMLIVPDPSLCPWADAEKSDPAMAYTDEIFVVYDGAAMEKTNMQLTVFNKEGILYNAEPPTAESAARYWRVCKVWGYDIYVYM